MFFIYAKFLPIGSMYGISANMNGVFVDGKWQTIYTIHTDPSWVGKILLHKNRSKNRSLHHGI